VLDPEGPIREADIGRLPKHVRKVPKADLQLRANVRYYLTSGDWIARGAYAAFKAVIEHQLLVLAPLH
jgi:hypothetical protein